ncbi:uncharacterized protein C8Q71DRAFT_111047 [Rhodofomes roseus]|uniref:ShKT domain-containing protein n=1 Tax=Rhodofomes roseus TaxID=34475 RepID=A0ABQ8KD50_9APHY|nr:uncharacterized protein C8Q71DRAFT_111047 [Rhodofomes roseus]KAH9835270.1 hypothetical protein C8Q71DRAFT_111047 [Rhodofomes roseus]
MQGHCELARNCQDRAKGADIVYKLASCNNMCGVCHGREIAGVAQWTVVPLTFVRTLDQASPCIRPSQSDFPATFVRRSSILRLLVFRTPWHLAAYNSHCGRQSDTGFHPLRSDRMWHRPVHGAAQCHPDGLNPLWPAQLVGFCLDSIRPEAPEDPQLSMTISSVDLPTPGTQVHLSQPMPLQIVLIERFLPSLLHQWSACISPSYTSVGWTIIITFYSPPQYPLPRCGALLTLCRPPAGLRLRATHPVSCGLGKRGC